MPASAPPYRIWDLHCHFPTSGGLSATARVEKLLRAADRMGVERCVRFAFDLAGSMGEPYDGMIRRRHYAWPPLYASVDRS